MNTILAIETATSACSVALLYNGSITEQYKVGNNLHSKELLSMVDKLLRDAQIKVNQLDAIAVGQGPGSFTGLRIGIGVGQGLAYSTGLPMIAICPLHTLASEFDAQYILAGFDARMSQIYWSGFTRKNGVLFRDGCVQVSNPSDIILPDPQKNWLAVGSAWTEYQDLFSKSVKQQLMIEDVVHYPKASVMLKLANLKLDKGDVVNATEFAPVYIRDNVAKKKV